MANTRTFDKLLATLAAADGHLRAIASLQLDFPSVVAVNERALLRSRAVLHRAGSDPLAIGALDLARDDTDELLSRVVAADLGEDDDNTDEEPREAVAAVSQDGRNAPAVPLDDGPEGTADDTVPLETDEESAEVIELTDDDLVLEPVDTEEELPTDPRGVAPPSRGSDDVVVMEEDEDEFYENTEVLRTPPGKAPEAEEKDEDEEATVVVKGKDLEEAKRRAGLDTDEEDADAASVNEATPSKEEASQEVAEKREGTPAQGTQRKTAPKAKPKIKPKVKASAKKPAKTSTKDASAKFYAASASIPTIRDESTPKPRAAAIQLDAEGGGAKMLGDEAEDEPIPVGGVEDEEMLDMDVDGLTLEVEDAWDETEWEDADEDDDEIMELDADALEMVEPPHIAPSITQEELQETLARARRAAKQGNIEAGVNFYSDVLDADPDHVEAYIGRGRLHLDLGDYSRAMSDFTVAEDLDPDSPEPQVAVGDLYFARKDYRKAIEYFDAALEMQSDHAMAFCRRGISHYYKRNYKQALADLSEAVRLDPDIPNINTFVSMAKKKAARQR